MSEKYGAEAIAEVREAFLTMIADSTDFEVTYEVDTNDNGRSMDCSTFRLAGSAQSLEAFCKALGIEPKWKPVNPDDPRDGSCPESIDETIQRFIEGGTS